MQLVSPFIAISAIIKIKTIVSDTNLIANGKPPTGIKQAAFGEDISLEAIKKKSKELGVTINDIVMAVCSVSIKEYFESKGDNKTSHVQISIPFTMREPILKLKGFKLENDFAVLPLKLNLCSSFKDAMTFHKEQMD